MVKKELQVKSVNLIEPRSFSYRGIVVADISEADYEFTLILVHLKSKVENKLGESALKRHKQVDRLRETIEEKLQAGPDANIIICGDFNDFPGRDEQEETAEVEDLMARMVKCIPLDDGTEVQVYSPMLAYSDRGANGELWTERTKKFGSVLLDYFFLTEGVNDEFIGIDHIYPEELTDILDASDHIPIVLDLGGD